jgi:hypothetical protein
VHLIREAVEETRCVELVSALRQAADRTAMIAALVIVPACSASARTTSAEGDPSLGGTRAAQGEFPWMVRLSMASR